MRLASPDGRLRANRAAVMPVHTAVIPADRLNASLSTPPGNKAPRSELREQAELASVREDRFPKRLQVATGAFCFLNSGGRPLLVRQARIARWMLASPGTARPSGTEYITRYEWKREGQRCEIGDSLCARRH
jgi:hypothetical protein